jgi:hypothetical protein
MELNYEFKPPNGGDTYGRAPQVENKNFFIFWQDP